MVASREQRTDHTRVPIRRCILPTRPGDKPGDLLMVALDHNFFAFRYDAVKNAT